MIDNDFTTENKIEETSAINITVGETSGVSVGTRVAVNHNASDPNQHTIGAITGLRSELDKIEELKTVYSNKIGMANYYKCSDGPHDSYGYFVSLVDPNTVKKCNGNNDEDIFGVTVNDAAFVGGQPGGTTINPSINDNLVLVATTGLVIVQCDSRVATGDYVVANVDGIARKTEPNRAAYQIKQYGYKVVCVHKNLNNDNLDYASIMLGAQSDVTDKISASINDLDVRLESNEETTKMAVNLAQQAVNELEKIDTSKLVTSEKIEDIEGAVNDSVSKADGALSDALNASIIASQAKEIANSAATYAESIKNEAVNKANNALAETQDLRDQFSDFDEQITNVEDRVTFVTKTISNQCEVVESWDKADKTKRHIVYYVKNEAEYYYFDNNVWKHTSDASMAGLPVSIAGIQIKTDENSSNIDSLTSWQGKTKDTMARLEQKADENGAYIQSTVASMDKYAVGLHSQAYGFTLEQAADILEEGMIYVPTDDLTETYSYMDGDEQKTYTQEFYKWFLYRWSKIGNQYKWISVDKDYNEIDINTSGPSVYFVNAMPPTVDDTHGYWYKTGEAKNINGDVVETNYNVHTLYKWSTYTTKDENDQDVALYQWVPVATLAGNSKSRAVSLIRQDADRIEASITTLDNKYAGTHMFIDNNKSVLQDIVSWKGENGESLATFASEACDKYASSSQVAKIVDKDGNINEASIVTAVKNNASSIYLSADNITFDGFASFKAKVEAVEDNAVYNTQVEYALSNSATTFVAVTDWSTTAPTWESGKYMWQRTAVTKGDNVTTYSSPTCIQGAKGADGTGVTIKGTAYVKDITVDDTIIGNEYILYKDAECSVQLTNAQDGDSYLVSGYLFAYSGADDKFTCCGKIQGPSGETPIISINSDGYWVINGSSSGVKAQGDMPTVEINADGYWVINGDNTGVSSKGEVGIGVAAIVNYYMASSRSSGVVAGESGWMKNDSDVVVEKWTTDTQSTYATINASKPYLWNYEVTQYTSATKADDITDPTIIGNYSKDGNGISSVEEFYCISASNSCSTPTPATLNGAVNYNSVAVAGTWYKTSPPTDLTNKYLWNCERITYTDGSYDIFEPALIGTHGDKGAPAPQVMKEEKQFHVSDSNNTAPNKESSYWSTVPINYQKGKYVWTRSVYTMDDNSVVAGDAYLDKNFTTISNWCKENNESYIDGANIYAGSITADKIDVESLTVHKDFKVSIKESIDNIEIGGRNLIKLSQLAAVNCQINASSTNDINISSVASGNMSLITIGGDYEPGDYILNATGSKAGKSFRLLFDKKLDNTYTENASYSDYGYPYFKDYVTLPVKLTFTDVTNIGFVAKDSDGAQTITGLKLEKGNVSATDWTPAPEDMATGAELSVAKDSISSKVSSSDYNSKMEQLDQAISSKVENNNTGGNCSWTMTPDKFEVSATTSGKEGGIIVDANGLEVNGIVNAKAGGNIGGWNIVSDAIYSNESGLFSGICSVYDNEYYTEGLIFSGNEVTGYTGSSPIVHIPRTYVSDDGSLINITKIRMSAFNGCNVLTDIIIPNCITEIGSGAFYDCKNLTSIIIPNSVKKMGNVMFQNCSSLKSVILGNGITSIYKSIFANCSSLESITIPFVGQRKSGTGSTHFGYIFGASEPQENSSYVPSSLKTVIITGGQKIDTYAFYRCKNITSIVIPSSITSIDECAFLFCDKLTIYAQHKSGAAGWKDGWNLLYTEDDDGGGAAYCNVVWNYNILYQRQSLIDNKFYYPRFYAGAYCEGYVPKSNEDAKFLVLEDGSLYASAAKIEGSVDMKTGKIGRFIIQENDIISDTSKITLHNDGSMVVQKLQINDYCKANSLMVTKVSGTYDNSAALYFNEESNQIRPVSVDIGFEVIKEGDPGNYGGSNWVPGSANIFVNTINPTDRQPIQLESSKTFDVQLIYGAPNNGQTTKHAYITVKSEDSSATFNVPYRIGPGNQYLHRVDVEEREYNEVMNTPITSILSSGSLVPSKDGLNLGQGSGTTWDYAYLKHEAHTSDKKAKNNIVNIDEGFSERLINGLAPKSYTLKTAETPRTHYGFIAQDVEELLCSLGTSVDEVGIVCKSKPGEPDGEDNHYSLNYINLIAPMVSVIQQLSKRVEELEEKLKETE